MKDDVGESAPRPDALYALLLVVSLGSSAMVHFPITGAYFHSDDFVNLQQIVNSPLARYLATPYGGHVLLFRNALFHVSYDLFGPHPAPFFWTVFLTHLANVGLLFHVTQLLTASPRLACFAAVLWGTSPVNDGSLGWYSAYGHAIVGTVVLLLLWRLLKHVTANAAISTREALAICLLSLVAATSFGVGIAMAITFPVALLVICRTTSTARIVLLALPAVVPMLFWATYRAAESLWGLSPTYRLFLFAVAPSSHVAVMVPHLLGSGLSQLIGGFWLPANAYPGAVSLTIIALCGAGVIGTLASPPPLASRRLIVALLGMATAVYAIIAVGRAALLAPIPLHGADTARYHYVGPLLLCVVLCVVLARIGVSLALRETWSSGLLALFVVLTMSSWLVSGRRIDQHPEYGEAAERVGTRIRSAAAAAPIGQAVFLPNAAFAGGWMGQNVVLGGSAGIFTIFFPTNVVDGRPIFFIEPDAKKRAVALPGSRLASVLVAAPTSTAEMPPRTAHDRLGPSLQPHPGGG